MRSNEAIGNGEDEEIDIQQEKYRVKGNANDRNDGDCFRGFCTHGGGSPREALVSFSQRAWW